jgi:hypothetical protein
MIYLALGYSDSVVHEQQEVPGESRQQSVESSDNTEERPCSDSMRSHNQVLQRLGADRAI